MGLKVATILCADVSKEPALPHIFDNFPISKIYFNKMWAYILSGQKLRWNHNVQPSHYVIRQVIVESPLMSLMAQNSHYLIGCNHSVKKYCSHIRLTGFNAVNLHIVIRDHKQYCKKCPLVKAVLSHTNPVQLLANRFYRGPDDFVASVLSQNPLAVSQLDEIGPWYIENEQRSVKVWVLILIEIVTRKVYLVPMQFPNTIRFIKALEILQSRRGRMTKIIIDQHPAHLLLGSKKPTSETTLTGVPDTL